MEPNVYYQNRFQNRYNLKISFWSAVRNFFGASACKNYMEAVDSIASKTALEALRSDVETLKEDAKVVAKQNRLPEIKKIRKKYSTSMQ